MTLSEMLSMARARGCSDDCEVFISAGDERVKIEYIYKHSDSRGNPSAVGLVPADALAVLKEDK